MLLTVSNAYVQGPCPGEGTVSGLGGAGQHLTSMTFMHFIDKEDKVFLVFA